MHQLAFSFHQSLSLPLFLSFVASRDVLCFWCFSSGKSHLCDQTEYRFTVSRLQSFVADRKGPETRCGLFPLSMLLSS
jgi:hypothetical protein